MGHNVGAAADRAVKRSEKVKPSERTLDQILYDVRLGLTQKLHVPGDDLRILLARYDEAVRAVVEEQFKLDVTLQENASLRADLDAGREDAAQLRATIAELTERTAQDAQPR